jgi:hypothetical protein
MLGHDSFHSHSISVPHHRIEIFHLEPQQHAIPVWLVVEIPDRPVVMVGL